MNWENMRIHLADPKVCDFSVPREFYEFHLPSPEPDLSYLRRSLEFDMDLARELFVPGPFWEDE